LCPRRCAEPCSSVPRRRLPASGSCPGCESWAVGVGVPEDEPSAPPRVLGRIHYGYCRAVAESPQGELLQLEVVDHSAKIGDLGCHGQIINLALRRADPPAIEPYEPLFAADPFQPGAALR